MSFITVLIVALKFWGCLFAISATAILHYSRLEKNPKNHCILRIEQFCSLLSVFSVLRCMLSFQVVGSTKFLLSLIALVEMLLVCVIYRYFVKTVDADLLLRSQICNTVYRRDWVVACSFVYWIGAGISIFNFFKPMVLSYGADAAVVAGPLYVYAELLCFAGFLIVIAELLRELKYFSVYELEQNILFCSLPLLALVIETVTQCEFLLDIGFACSALVLFSFYEVGLAQEKFQRELEHEKEKRELIENNTQLMLSQVRPHFLYNSLASIQYLCKKDPDMAGKAVKHLSSYLRSNLTSIEKKEMVPFKKEMEQVENYIWLEQMRYGDDLLVNYDIQYDRFLIPPMTVQSLAENAVRHGLMQKHCGGVLDISSVKEGDQIIIRINDDGQGFDPAVKLNPKDPCEGISRVRARLKAMCNGTMDVDSAPEQGTRITIYIPCIETGTDTMDAHAVSGGMR